MASDLLRFGLIGLGPGAVYGLLVIGIVVVYRGSGVVNFAGGGFMLFGAATFIALRGTALGDVGAIIVSLLLSAAMGVILQLLIMYPMRRSAPIARVVATLAVLVVLETAARLRYGPAYRPVEALLPENVVKLAGVKVAVDGLIILGLATVLTVALWLVYRFTRFGLATTAVAENVRAAAALGWSPNTVAAINWSIGGTLAGGAGILLAPLLGFSPTAYTLTIVPALAVAVIAGFRSFPLALAGGVVIGIIGSEGVYIQTRYPHGFFGFIPSSGLSTAAPFVVMILFMVIRGQALPLRGDIADRLPKLGTGIVRVKTVIVVFTVAVIAIWATGTVWSTAVSNSAAVALIALSIVVITGYAGQLSLAQYGVAGLAALFSSRLADAAGLPFPLAAVLGIGLTVLVGLVVALPAVRVRGVGLAVVTLGMAVVINSAVLSNPDWTGGYVTGTVVPSPRLFGMDLQSIAHPHRWATFCLVVLAVAALMVCNLRRGRSGRRLIAVRGNERAAASLGLNVVAAKLYAFAVGSVLAGAAGVLLAFQNAHVSFDEYGPYQSVQIIPLVVINGIGFVVGSFLAGAGVVGGLIYTLVGGPARDNPVRFAFVLGVLGLVVVVVHPNGVVSDLSDRVFLPLRRRFRRGRSDVADVDDSVAPGSNTFDTVAPKALELRDLTVRFGAVTAVSGVSLIVQPGEVVGLIGPNGAGKTTIVDAVTGFVPKYEGQIFLDGKLLDGWRAARRARAGLTRSFQSLELFEDLSVADNLRIGGDDGRLRHFFLDLIRSRRQRLSPAAMAAVQQFELSGLLDRRPGELSYALRRSVAIARAVATSPSVVLLDEPAAGLDGAARAELEQLIVRLAKEWQMAVLLIEHDVGLVMRVCDRIVALEFGGVIATGSAAEIRQNQAVVSAYLGQSEPAKDPVVQRQGSRGPDA
jgi:ABC-type branched-subunit amino acid transport system ATPase component/ABC-type branched-subunit amino acid transport system permease subunit